jgi:DNA-binding TFAR19-related protein (PDSD5 family)
MSKLSVCLDSTLMDQVRAAARCDQTTVQAIVRDLLTEYAQARLRSGEHQLCRPERASWRLAPNVDSGYRGAA